MYGKRLLAVAAGALLMLSPGARADFLVDDLEHAGARNYLGADWGFADDHYNGGVSKILNGDSTQFGPQPADYRWTFRGGYGEGVEGANANAAVMQYKLGAVKPLPAGGNPNVSLKTDFVGYGEAPLSLSGSTGLSFYIRADQTTKVDVYLNQNFGKTGWYPSYSKSITVGTTWQKVTVLWSEMALPTWAAAPKPVLMDYIAKCLGISFSVDLGNNSNPAFQLTGKLLVDSLVILGMGSGPIDKAGFCASCVSAAGAIPQGYPLTSFDAADPLLISAINDVVKAVGVPNAQSDPSATPTTVESSPVTMGTGFNGSGGAKINYVLGPTVVKDFTQPPSAKITIPLKKATWDSCISAAGATGISFFYMTTIPSTQSIQVAVASNIAYKGYASPYVDIPGTGGQWKLATIPWSKLILPSWSDNVTPTFEQLSELTVSYIGNQNDQGSIAIDNIVITGISVATLVPYTPQQLAIRNYSAARNSGMSASARVYNGMVTVKCALLLGATNARVELLNLAGKVVGSHALSGVGEVSFAQHVSNGMYLVRIRTAGEKSVTLPLHITR